MDKIILGTSEKRIWTVQVLSEVEVLAETAEDAEDVAYSGPILSMKVKKIRAKESRPFVYPVNPGPANI